MAIGLPVAIDAAAKAQLLAKLRAHWGWIAPDPKFFHAPGGANKGTHLVLRDSHGLTIGLKAAERGIAKGTKKELAACRLATRMSLPLATKTHLVTKIDGGLGGLKNEIIASEWNADCQSLDQQLPADLLARVQADPSALLRCYGQWLAFGLAIGTHDRHTGNWIYSSDGERIGMIDLEESFGGAAMPEIFRPPLQSFGLLDLLRAESGQPGPLRPEIEAGLRLFHRRWFAPTGIASILASHIWCAGYTNEWWKPNEDAFVSDVIRQLLG